MHCVLYDLNGTPIYQQNSYAVFSSNFFPQIGKLQPMQQTQQLMQLTKLDNKTTKKAAPNGCVSFMCYHVLCFFLDIS